MTPYEPRGHEPADAFDAALDRWLVEGGPPPSPVLDDLTGLGAALRGTGGGEPVFDEVWARAHPRPSARLARVTMRVAAVWIAVLLAVGVLAGQRLAGRTDAELTRSATDAVDAVDAAVREMHEDADAGRDAEARARAQRAVEQVEVARDRLSKLETRERAQLERRLDETLRQWPEEVEVEVPPLPPLRVPPSTTPSRRLPLPDVPTTLPPSPVTVPGDVLEVPTTIPEPPPELTPDALLGRSGFDVTDRSGVRLSCGLDEQGASTCDVGSGPLSAVP